MTTDFKDSAPSPELGYTGLQSRNGMVTEEFLPELKGRKANQVYKQMSMNDPTVGAILFAIENTIRGVNWDVKAADHPEGEQSAEFFKTVMGDMEKPWSEVINDILSFISYGHSITEPVFKRRMGRNNPDKRFRSRHTDGMWGWRRLPSRSQCSVKEWVFQGDRVNQGPGGTVTVTRGPNSNVNDLKGMVQRNPNTLKDKYIPRERFLLFRTNSQLDNPEGKSLLRTAYRPWFFKTRLEEIEAIGIERDLNGLPTFWVPHHYLSQDATPDQRAAIDSIKKIGNSIRNNQQGCIVFPQFFDENGNKMFDIQLLGNGQGGGKAVATDTIIHRYSSQIAQTVLADFILMGQQSVGSFALSENKVKLFYSAISAYLDSIADVFNKEAIPKLWALNGFDPESMPELIYGQIERHSLQELGEYFGKLISEEGLQVDESLEGFLRDKADAPERSGPAYQTPRERINDASIQQEQAQEGRPEDSETAITKSTQHTRELTSSDWQ